MEYGDDWSAYNATQCETRAEKGDPGIVWAV